MKCMAREIRRDEVDQGITQRDQFNTDEFSLRETLVREPHQNSLDGISRISPGLVRTRIKLVEPKKENALYWKSLLEPLRPHLEASRIDLSNVDLSMPRILLIEDFGTTGLLGATNSKDDLNFSDFWRRFGLSHKKEGAGGRWGLGKLVFTSASAIGTLFGLTVRESDPGRTRYLMGQAILNKHKIGAIDYAPHVFFAVPAVDGFQLPESNPENIDAFANAAGFSRIDEPGLSIAIVCLTENLEPDKLLPHVISNYFFPILTSQLVVEIDDKVVDNASFDSLAATYGEQGLADGHLTKFIRRVDASRRVMPPLVLTQDWIKNGVASSITADQATALRKAFAGGELTSVRAPLVLRRKNDAEEETYVDTFLQRTPGLVKGQAFFVRGSITVPGEAKSFRGRQSFGALIASDSAVVEFLGDSENPAHTRWVGSAIKLTDGWKNPGVQISAIKKLLNDINELVTEAEDQIDESALIEFFSIPKPVTASQKKSAPKPSSPPIPPALPPRRPRAFNVSPKNGGFVIKGNPVADVALPYQIKIVTAYGVRRGNPFKKHKRQDFDLRTSKLINAKATGASWAAPEANIILLDVASPDFRFEVSGFDTERDLGMV